jgi:lipopolysaccharide/colanic/teichoic acid biosynthesis glycosyltransferase
VEDARQKLQFDLFYVKNHNPMFDLWILLQTLDIVIWNKSHRDAVQSPGLQEQSPDRRIA